MNSVQIEENVKSLVKQVSSQEISKDDFVYELLLAYGHRKSVVSRVKSGERNLAKTAGEVILKRHLYFKPCTSNLFAEIDALKNSKTVATNKIRFVVVTDFSQLIAIDTKTQDTLDIELGQLAKHFDFFLPWAGMEKMVYRGENPADVKAAEKMADFFDHIKATNYPVNATKEQLHEMVVFLNRLLFCFFAEDTKIFSENQFTNLLNQHTQEDGSDLVGVFERLFDVLNTPAHQRNDLPKYLNDFPYVNGGLFKKQIKVPTFDAKARRMLLDSGSLDWSDINPDIFGSMIQGVADPETRSKMGMHYTSVSNIMKVIEPLFLNDLYEEFDKCNDNINKLKKLQVRLSRIKFFDPACGSGNFLIITYKEIRELEIEILKRIRELEGESDSGMMGLFDESHSAIRLDQFYGIELDDFAHEMAILSLWLVEHQMNMVFETEFGYTAPTLPLKQSGRIVAGNATRIDWELVCPVLDSDEVYILGNPPYLGSNYQTSIQKEDLQICFSHVSGIKNLDYVSCWIIKAAKYILNRNCHAAFVTTNSICQGEQVDMLWPRVFAHDVELSFAYQSFKWVNSAKNNAGVTCIIVGLSKCGSVKKKSIFTNDVIKSVVSISPYLIEGSNLTIVKRRKPISHIKPMVFGSKPVDGGNLLLSGEEKEELISLYPESKPLIKKLLGADEFIKGYCRWCLWITDDQLEFALSFPPIKERIEKTREFRLNSKKLATQKSASSAHKFGEIRHSDANSIIVPRVSSERREYLLSGFLESDVVILDRAQAIPDATLYEFGVISSSMHMAWTNAVTGRLETRLNYSSSLCYNNFPLPIVSAKSREIIEEKALSVLEARELFPELNYAQLYDPNQMPIQLKNAHKELDLEVDKLYSDKMFNDNSERLTLLFRLYEEQVGE
ncbi:class I SAM-dependent DNA methyltransferase [Vibrio parahaemolyticus]|nr:class I SAM-dependent DNA methyltransferase [Vibrio parahaemolyticus]ELI5424502.1 class I SAM-dependent DNA methyltransferase [Vibrio parahaemolyticus]